MYETIADKIQSSLERSNDLIETTKSWVNFFDSLHFTDIKTIKEEYSEEIDDAFYVDYIKNWESLQTFLINFFNKNSNGHWNFVGREDGTTIERNHFIYLLKDEIIVEITDYLGLRISEHPLSCIRLFDDEDEKDKIKIAFLFGGNNVEKDVNENYEDYYYSTNRYEYFDITININGVDDKKAIENFLDMSKTFGKQIGKNFRVAESVFGSRISDLAKKYQLVIQNEITYKPESGEKMVLRNNYIWMYSVYENFKFNFSISYNELKTITLHVNAERNRRMIKIIKFKYLFFANNEDKGGLFSLSYSIVKENDKFRLDNKITTFLISLNEKLKKEKQQNIEFKINADFLFSNDYTEKEENVVYKINDLQEFIKILETGVVKVFPIDVEETNKKENLNLPNNTASKGKIEIKDPLANSNFSNLNRKSKTSFFYKEWYVMNSKDKTVAILLLFFLPFFYVFYPFNRAASCPKWRRIAVFIAYIVWILIVVLVMIFVWRVLY